MCCFVTRVNIYLSIFYHGLVASEDKLPASQMAGSVVMPGVRLCPSDPVHLQGHGTYTQHGYIYSSLVGELRLVTNADKTVTVEVDGLAGDSLVPGQQDVVTVKIVSVNPR